MDSSQAVIWFELVKIRVSAFPIPELAPWGHTGFIL
jgi:hypothetical protein